MPSPFPGMDPFIEGSLWQSFHNQYVPALGQSLVPQLGPGYAMDVAQDIYLVRDDGISETREPDIAVVHDRREASASVEASGVAGGVAVLQPMQAQIPFAHERSHRFIEIRDLNSNEVITVIELLSPTNKIDHKGRQRYEAKRQDLLESGVSLVEVDLLRSGRRLPINPLPAQSDYLAVVCRAEEAPEARVYAWTIRDQLPDLPVPLRSADADVVLHLQVTFQEVFLRGGFQRRLNYSRPLIPPVSETDHAWMTQILAKFDGSDSSLTEESSR